VVIISLSLFSTRLAWVDVGSGAWIDFEYTVMAKVSWFTVSSETGTIAGDRSIDARVYVPIDWSQVSSDVSDIVYGIITFASKSNDHPRTASS
jgi:hypothetical protein